MRIIIIKSLSTTLSTGRTEVRGSSAGVTGAVSLSDLELIKGGVPQDAGGGPWIADLG